MAEDRPDIPDPMKQAVRTRCGFGCVICGNPLITYEHMIDYSIVLEHTEDNLTLLCDQHQRESTNKLLPPQAVASANANPINVQRGVTSPYALHFGAADVMEVRLGTDEFSWAGDLMAPLIVDDWPLIFFRRVDGGLYLDLTMHDEFNWPVLLIRDNELVVRSDAWDINFEGHTLTMREAKRKFFARIVFEPPHRVVIDRGRFLHNGLEIVIDGNKITVPGGRMTLSGNRWDSPVGLVFGFSPHYRSPIPMTPWQVNRYHFEAQIRCMSGECEEYTDQRCADCGNAYCELHARHPEHAGPIPDAPDHP